MTHYPILFGFRDLIAGNGFIAGVDLNGRALLVDEGDGFWMYGVYPGGVAAGGKTQGEAQSEFRTAYRSVLLDIAGEVASFDEFKQQVEQFFNEVNEPTAAEWAAAVEQVRQGKVDADWLPHKKAESALSVNVMLVVRPTPSVNTSINTGDETKLAA